MPKVSVCIPTYNRAHYLTYSVNSVLAQTYTDFELIICDDASSDNTPDVVKQWDDPRIRYIRHPQNIRRSRNMRSGFEAATGEYFIKFDDDDALCPEFLEKTVKVLDDRPEIDLVCTSHWIIDANHQRDENATRDNAARWGKDKLQNGKIPDLTLQTFHFQSLQVGSTLFRLEALQAVDFMRSFPPEADGCEDFDLLVRLAIAGKQGYFIPEYLMEYRIHGGQQTQPEQNLRFLTAKLLCLDSYHFPEAEIEQLRCAKLSGTREALGLRCIELGEDDRGRELLQQAVRNNGSRKAQLGLWLSYLPLGLRKLAFQVFRRARPRDYSERVREQAES
ncbi:MAG: glycosyltransferase family 2 protein [Cyanobacteria bacterium SID2]|nr:glycosyltransferase family 2 protein [Cyanobacteria bacterium SID2]MBP0003642.1 glycosyltransferase family 2 protein [Cyanobacteria bacterium SBC]